MTRRQFFRYLFWEWVEPIGVALAIALIIIKFVMALYIIPTGSMQPTLRGKGDYGEGDKVLVNKFVYRFEPPRRWDVFVFKYPYQVLACKRCERDVKRDIPLNEDFDPKGKRCQVCDKKLSVIEKDYIKRCVGLPGDELMISDGDILLKENKQWVFAEKTEEAQSALWITVCGFRSTPELFAKGWKCLPPGSMAVGKSIVLSGSPAVRLVWTLPDELRGRGDKGRMPINDRVNERDWDAPFVGDLRISLELDSKPASGELLLDITRNKSLYRASLDFAKASFRLIADGAPLKEGSIPPDAKSIAFCRLDGRLILFLDSEKHPAALPGFTPGSDDTVTVATALSFSGPSLSLKDLEISRDIYYTSEAHNLFSDVGKDRGFRVPAGHYLAMGDNSFFSSDSRDWGPLPANLLIGKALMVLLPPSRVKLIR